MLTFADLFSGCGGFSAGFNKNAVYSGLLAADNNASAGEVYKHNLPDIPFELRDLHDIDDVATVVGQLKGRCNVLLGGPPCQGFSTLGKRRDADRRSTLVDRFLEIALEIGPDIIVMENVRGITSKTHCSGVKYPERIRQVLGKGSYNVADFIINAAEFGLAQTRRRYVMVAVRRESSLLGSPDLLVDGILRQRTERRMTLRDAIGDLIPIESGGGAAELSVQDGSQQEKIIFNHQAMRHGKDLLERLAHVPPGGGLLDVPKHLLTEHLGRMVEGHYGEGGHIKNIYGRLAWDKPCGTIVAGIDKITCGRFVHPEADRLLTPRECARIQSFPDPFRFFGGRVAQYYMIGNAVPPRISEVIACAISEACSLSAVKRRERSPEKQSYLKNTQALSSA